MDYFKKAYDLLYEWKGDSYINGNHVIGEIGKLTERVIGKGNKALIVSNKTYSNIIDGIVSSLKEHGIDVIDNICPGAKPNTPRDDVYRIALYVKTFMPDVIVAIGGGSNIDASKIASILVSLGMDWSLEIDEYLGSGKVSEIAKKVNKDLIPVIAVETSASSGAHLTKYANVTDPSIGQKKLIVDPLIAPKGALFDYSLTTSMPKSITIDGALDALSHTYEVFCGAKKESYEKLKEIFETTLNLLLDWAKVAIDNPQNERAREALGLATDLGGYAIMIGGTSGGHLTSFSLVDIIGHGTACGIMNPYYGVFFEKAIQPQLKVCAKIFEEKGYGENISLLSGRELSISVAKAMQEFSRSIGAPTTLKEIKNYSHDVHYKRALSAAKDPDLKVKLENMPVSMTKDDVDEYMAPILLSAESGNFSLIIEKE